MSRSRRRRPSDRMGPGGREPRTAAGDARARVPGPADAGTDPGPGDGPAEEAGTAPVSEVEPTGDAGTDPGPGDGPAEEAGTAPVSEEELVAEEVERVAARAPKPQRRPGPLGRLYRGETSFDFVGRRRWWFIASSVIILAGIVSLGVRGLDLGITFKGGTAWTVRAPGVTQTQAVRTVEAAGLAQPTVEVLGSGSHEEVRVTADLNSLSHAARQAETTRVIHALAHLAHTTATAVSVTTVGPTWGGQVTQKAVIALIVFLVLVAVYISIRFEPKMAIGAFVALLHDLLVTAGVYSLAGFQVTPDTVIAVLTILGYSLYDTVVVFDRVRDNTKGLGSSGRMTYSEMVNLSMNQTLARSINTSLVAILPVLAVLVIGAELLGATTLQNYGLALFVGLLSGAYSSIFIASPVLAALKEREPRYLAIRQRIEQRGERLGLLTPSAAAAMLAGTAGGGGVRTVRPLEPGTLRPGQAKAVARQRAAGASAATATLEPRGVAVPPAANGSGTPAGGRPSANGGPAPARRPAARPRRSGKGKRRR
jgi:preprotein translocase subunit SecF